MNFLSRNAKILFLLVGLILGLGFGVSSAQAQTCEEIEGQACLNDIDCQVGDCADCAFCDGQLLICDISDCVLCGNGALNGEEQCDEGAGNSDTEADACRLDCTLPICGDGVVDSDEECDGGENCTASCLVEQQVTPTDDTCIQGSGFGGDYDANCQGCTLNPHLVSQGFAKDYAGFIGVALFAGLLLTLRSRSL